MPPSLQRRVGPLPVWGWAVVIVGGLLIGLYLRNRSGGNGVVNSSAADNSAAGGGGAFGGDNTPPDTSNLDPTKLTSSVVTFGGNSISGAIGGVSGGIGGGALGGSSALQLPDLTGGGTTTPSHTGQSSLASAPTVSTQSISSPTFAIPASAPSSTTLQKSYQSAKSTANPAVVAIAGKTPTGSTPGTGLSLSEIGSNNPLSYSAPPKTSVKQNISTGLVNPEVIKSSTTTTNTAVGGTAIYKPTGSKKVAM